MTSMEQPLGDILNVHLGKTELPEKTGVEAVFQEGLRCVRPRWRPCYDEGIRWKIG